MLHNWQYGGHGEPQVAERITRSPWNGVRLEQYEDNWVDPTKIMTITISALFTNNTSILRTLFPFYPFEENTARVEEWIAFTSQYGPLSSQAPFPEVHLQRRALEIGTSAWGQQFTIDGSIFKTPLEQIYKRIHMSQLISGLYYTIYYHILTSMLEVPNIYHQSASIEERNGMSAVEIAENIINLRGRLFGALSRGVEGRSALANLVVTAREIMQDCSARMPQEIPLNFIFLPAHVKDYYPFDMAQFRPMDGPQMYERIHTYLRKMEIDIQPEKFIAPVELPNFNEAKVFWIERHREETGAMRDPLETVSSVVQFCIINPFQDENVVIMDHSKGSKRTIFSQNDDIFTYLRRPVANSDEPVLFSTIADGDRCRDWFQAMKNAYNVVNSTESAIATIDAQNRPHVNSVLILARQALEKHSDIGQFARTMIQIRDIIVNGINMGRGAGGAGALAATARNIVLGIVEALSAIADTLVTRVDTPEVFIAANEIEAGAHGNRRMLRERAGNLSAERFSPIFRRCIAFRTLRFRMSRVVLGHASSHTGVVLVGRRMENAYTQPDLRRETFYIAFRFGFGLLHPEHIQVIPDALHKKYLGGGNSIVAKLERDMSLDQDAYNLSSVINDNDRTNGDLFIYGIPDAYATDTSIIDNLTVTCAGGRWNDPGRALYGSDQHNWLKAPTDPEDLFGKFERKTRGVYDDADQARGGDYVVPDLKTALRMDGNPLALDLHGVGNRRTEIAYQMLCTRTRIVDGKYVNIEVGGTTGPLAPETETSRDRWDGNASISLGSIRQPMLITAPRQYTTAPST